jgi:hypothetical protein
MVMKGGLRLQKTGGCLKQENIDKHLNDETKKLSPTTSMAFIKRWYAGFNDGVKEVELKSVKKEAFGENKI